MALERAYVQAIVSAFGAILNSPEMTDSKTRRIWLILDEFPQLGKLENFAQYLEVGRSKGMCVIQGLQDLAQLEEIYGRATANVWRAISGTYIVCRSQGVETVDWLTRFFGDKVVKQFRNTRASDGKTSRTELDKTVPVVSADDIAGLGPDRGLRKGILGLLSLNNEHGIYRLIWPYVTLPEQRPAQIPALWTSAMPSLTDTDVRMAQEAVLERNRKEQENKEKEQEPKENIEEKKEAEKPGLVLRVVTEDEESIEYESL